MDEQSLPPRPIEESDEETTLNLSPPSSPLPKYSESTVPSYADTKDFSIDQQEVQDTLIDLQQVIDDLPNLGEQPFRKALGREGKSDRSGRKPCNPRPGKEDTQGFGNREPGDGNLDGIPTRGGDGDGNSDENNNGNDGEDEDAPRDGGDGDRSERDESEDEREEEEANDDADDEPALEPPTGGMESLFLLPRPLQRRLTKMYADTKGSYDFVREPYYDGLCGSLHRKLRIQKDRLVSWGLAWSDPSQSPDIDESISRAGLSEVVGSVMSTIKEILAEAEPLWQSLRDVGKSELDRKNPLVIWDQTRFEDLVRDLTMSIDTLYDLSRTRTRTRRPHSTSSKSDALTPVSRPAPSQDFPLGEPSLDSSALSRYSEQPLRAAVVTAQQLSYIEQSLKRAKLTDDVQGIMSSLKAVIRKANQVS